jgi:hypothetical protein
MREWRPIAVLLFWMIVVPAVIYRLLTGHNVMETGGEELLGCALGAAGFFAGIYFMNR